MQFNLIQMHSSLGLACFLLLQLASAFAYAGTSGSKAANHLQSLSQTGSSGLMTCIDDSDCKKLEVNSIDYRCFMYVCYPWKDDSAIPADQKVTLCKKDNDCSQGQECFRHHSRRKVTKGLCFDEVARCENKNDCSEGNQCCNGHCCEQKYFEDLLQIPCDGHESCRSTMLGDFCCPSSNGSKICCNEDPNPPPPPKPKVASGASGQSSSLIIMTAASVVAMAILKNF